MDHESYQRIVALAKSRRVGVSTLARELIIIGLNELRIRSIREKEEAKEPALAPVTEGSSTPPEETKQAEETEVAKIE